jgi:adenosylhomocysteine nucleosidase
MLIWLCALKCEAKPVIDFYRLHKADAPSPFRLYRNQQVACVVSGIGRTAMHAATLWSHNLDDASVTTIRFNLGIAGQRDLDLGSLRLAASFADDNGSIILPANLPLDSSIGTMSLVTCDQPQDLYPADAMIDMEGQGFAEAARTLPGKKWFQSIKIISDNRHNPPHRDKAVISDLIAPHMPLIDRFARTTIDRANLADE